MPKNSRPDIQVLEERVVRLKSQLLEYKDLRLYNVTKKRLSAVSDELEQCMIIIHDIVKESPTINNAEFATLGSYPGEMSPEFSNDGDLLDTLLLSDSKNNDSTAVPYSSREIVVKYSENIQKCASEPTGILQINQFCQMMNLWYQCRFVPSTRNPNFYFKAGRIHEWIDLLIIAAGQAMHDGLFPSFKSDLERWANNLSSAKDDVWMLPYSVMQIQKFLPGSCTQEAVLIEKVVKATLYGDDFYPDERHSVEKIVIHNSEFTSEDLMVDKIIQSCSKLVITSTFDSSKYQEVS